MNCSLCGGSETRTLEMGRSVRFALDTCADVVFVIVHHMGMSSMSIWSHSRFRFGMLEMFKCDYWMFDMFRNAT